MELIIYLGGIVVMLIVASRGLNFDSDALVYSDSVESVTPACEWLNDPFDRGDSFLND